MWINQATNVAWSNKQTNSTNLCTSVFAAWVNWSAWILRCGNSMHATSNASSSVIAESCQEVEEELEWESRSDSGCWLMTCNESKKVVDRSSGGKACRSAYKQAYIHTYTHICSCTYSGGRSPDIPYVIHNAVSVQLKWGLYTCRGWPVMGVVRWVSR